MNNIALILLNYNSWSLSIKFLNSLNKLKTFKNIYKIIVDNKSTNDSVEKLYNYANDSQNIKIISNNKNGGYAYGNNIGLRTAIELGFDYAIIVNNDIEFLDDNFIESALNIFNSNKSIACVSPIVLLPNGKETNKNLIRKGVWYETFGSFKYKKLSNKYERLTTKSGISYCINYRPQGCCMIVDLQKMKEINFLDEHTFLYMEESILAEKILNAGYLSVCSLENKIIHNHKSTTSSIFKKNKYLKIYLSSSYYYYKHYLRMNKLSILLCQLFNIIKIYVGVL